MRIAQRPDNAALQTLFWARSVVEVVQLLITRGDDPHLGAESRVLHLVLGHVSGDLRGEDAAPS